MSASSDLPNGRSAAERFLERLRHCDTVRVAPFAIDDKRVAPACRNRRTHRAIRRQVALDAPRIERHRQTPVLRVPQLLPGQKDPRQHFPGGVEQVYALLGLAAAHRR